MLLSTINNYNISFGYKSILKKLYIRGELPTVKKGIYGEILTKNIDTCTIEHIIPKSKGGKSDLSNYALASAHCNQLRSDDYLHRHTTLKNVKEYLQQFVNVVCKNKTGNVIFDGNKYICELWKNLRKQGFKND